MSLGGFLVAALTGAAALKVYERTKEANPDKKPTTDDYVNEAKTFAGEMKEKAKEYAPVAKEKVKEYAPVVKEKAKEYAPVVKEKAKEVIDQVKDDLDL